MATRGTKPRKTGVSSCTDGEHRHPDHSAVLPRLRRMQGQLKGIEKMIEDRRYCVDILIQFRAALAALRNLEVEVFETHLRHCVTEAIHSENTRNANQKIEELTELLVRRSRL